MDFNLRSLIGKLDAECRNAIETAAGLCLTRTHYEVEIEHFLLKILDQDNTDLHRIFKHYDIDPGKVANDLVRSMDNFKTGNTRTPVLSPRLPQLFQQAWMIASLDYGAAHVRSGHILLAMLFDPEMRRLLLEDSPRLQPIPREELKEHFVDLTHASVEAEEVHMDHGVAEGASPDLKGTGKGSKTPALDQYTNNLTQKAKAGGIDPVLGRELEIRQMIDILTRRRQNNPILTGEAGVGKTAVVEGLALRIAQGDVPPALQHVALHALDLGLLQAGASVKGEFENRLKMVLDEVKKSPHPIIMFIDEAHTMIGAGGQAGQNDAANLLKPALARGELRTIAATTWSEYKKYFEKDAALARRFQVVKVDEPDEAKATIMIRGLAPMMENHHNVRILDEAVTDAVRLSHRYITGRQLPDKAVSVLDTACARVGISQAATPAEVEDLLRKIDAIHAEIRALEREAASEHINHSERIQTLKDELKKDEVKLGELQTKWQQEKDLVEQIRDIRAQLEDLANPKEKTDAEAQSEEEAAPPADPAALRDQLKQLNDQLTELQGDTPLVHVTVDSQTVGEVISAWTGIPVGKMLADEITTVLKLDSFLGDRVIGQNHALYTISQRIRTSRANLDDPSRPIGVFMLVGPSGVGKTETALALADILYGGERNLITINMSEYQEAHTVSSLKGSPPGYVGYGEGGVLTEAVRRKPYSVVLLDEVEKAHPDVLELFFQVFDKGTLEDGEGREIDFKNTVIILTSNVGTDVIMRACLNAGDGRPDPDELMESLRTELRKAYKPAFLGRMIVIPYYPVQDEILKQIIRLKLQKIQKRIQANHKAKMIVGEDLIDYVAGRCTETDSGARNIDHILTGTLLPAISERVLERMAKGEAIHEVKVNIKKDGTLDYQVN